MVQDSEVLKLQAIAGEMDLHTRHLSFADIGLLLQNAESGNYEVGRRVEVVAQRTVFYLNATSPDPMKAELFDNADYRIALSHGIDREKLSEILYFGESEPAQVGVGPGEPAHYPPLWNAYTEFDPEKANRLLDELGMDERDSDGFRLAPNGETFSMSIETTQGRAEPVELVIEDWQEHLDIRARLRVVSRELLDQRTTINSLHDVRAWQGGRLPFEANLTKEQRFDQGSWTHGAWQRYLDTDGEQGEQPPEGHPWLRAYELNQQINRATDRDRQIELLLEAQELAAENLWLIGTVTHPPDPYIVNENLRNVPESVRYLLLFSFNPEAFYFAE
jgi:peptide/nickel transport system substrate-binding protein